MSSFSPTNFILGVVMTLLAGLLVAVICTEGFDNCRTMTHGKLVGDSRTLCIFKH